MLRHVWDRDEYQLIDICGEKPCMIKITAMGDNCGFYV